jgi:hypothetical protein
MYARLTIGCTLCLLSVSACTVRPATPATTGTASVASATEANPTPSSQPPCTPAGPEADLGALALDSVPRQFVRVRAGWYRLTASGFQHGGVLDPNIGRTTVVWGPATTPPRYDPGPATVTGSLGHADVVEGEETWVQLSDAQLWFLNSNGARLAMHACPPATFTVGPA